MELITRTQAAMGLNRDVSRLRNYEIEEYLPGRMVSEFCPFNGRFCEYGSDFLALWSVGHVDGRILAAKYGSARDACTTVAKETGIHEGFLWAELVQESPT